MIRQAFRQILAIGLSASLLGNVAETAYAGAWRAPSPTPTTPIDCFGAEALQTNALSSRLVSFLHSPFQFIAARQIPAVNRLPATDVPMLAQIYSEIAESGHPSEVYTKTTG